jgi:myogenesis-regulating glycosidase
VSCDEQRTRCLHISLNAARTNVTAGKPYKWGVGVANFDRMILPRHASEAPGDGRLTLQSRAAYDWPHVLHPWLREAGDPAGDGAPPTLVFTVGAADDARSATEELVLGRVLEETPGGRPLPPEHLLRDPIWTTWAKYKDAVTQEDVLAFAGEIARRDLPRSVMEIDDRWSVKYGDLEFDAAKFPDPAAMTATLHELGFLATLWIIPFANTDSAAVTSPETRDFFVKDMHGKVGEFDWWQPTRVAALDVTNPAACEWFISRLQRLQSCYDIDGFKFDAGEPSFLPRNAVTHTSLSCPSDYTRAWINNVAGHFPVSEARAGVPGTQSAAPLLRMFDRFSTWGDDNGLASVITALLTASILGYPLVLPDMIGGNAYDDEVPDAELMIRWAQASAAMPALQFSIPAWDLGESAAALTAASLRWRASVFWPAIAAGLPAATAHFTPITRPMWWAAPRDAAALATADQFMVGDDLVVAPVVVAGARARERVYLPPGLWERVRLCGAGGDVMDCEGDAVGAPIRGPVTLRDVPAPLDDMPTWRRVVE